MITIVALIDHTSAVDRSFNGHLFRHFIWCLEQMAAAAVSFAFALIDGNEAQRSGIDAVAQTALFTGTVWKHMAQMTITSSRTNLGPNHAVARVAFFQNAVGLERLGKARPTHRLSNLSIEVNKGSPETASA
jgi:hypothetical protein